MSSIVTLAFFVATAVIAGLVPTLLFFRTAADRKVLVVGGTATALSYSILPIGLPPLVTVGAGGLYFYPVWAFAFGFPVALVWRAITGAAPRPVTEEERLAEIQRRAREKARRLNRPG